MRRLRLITQTEGNTLVPFGTAGLGMIAQFTF
jgi:hypothetical protein